MRRQIRIKCRVGEYRQVAGGGLEPVHVLHQEECLEEADRELVVQVPVSHVHGMLCSGLQRALDAGKEHVEGDQRVHLLTAYSPDHLLDDGQHGTLAYGGVPSLEDVVGGQSAHGFLEQGELVGHKGVGAYEAVLVRVVPVGLCPVREGKQC